MGTGYTRADVANNIADGNIVNASDLDNEYDAIEAAFNSSTGHTHDGTAAEGAPITVVGPVQDLVVSATEVKPKTTNTLDLGTSALLYKDAYLQGNMYFRDTALKIVSSADGQLDIDADVELEVVAPTVDIDASTALTVDTASTTFTSTLFNVTGSANITGDLDVDNINIDGNTIISTDTNGAINITPNGTGAVNITATTNITGDLDIDNININGNTIISTDTNGDINLSPDGTGTVVINTDLDVDNINVNGNTIISTDTNGDINISPDGTGTVVIDTDLDVDNINVNGNTISSTDTNGDINLSPDGTGTVVINTDLDVDNININGNTIISTDTNGNIALTPDGTGEVDISKVDIDAGAIDGTTIGASSAAAGTFTTLTASGDLTVDTNTLYVDSTNNRVGIANASPSVELDVTGAAKISGDLTVDTDTLYVDSTNNRVGIGTSSPDEKMHVFAGSAGTVSASGNANLVIENSANSGVNILTPNNQNGQILFGDPDDNDVGRLQYNHTSNFMAFYTNANERMRIDSSGNVGIGTTSPSGKLNLATGASAACELRLTSNNTGSGAGDRGRIVVYSSKNDGTAYEAGKIEIDRSTGTTTEAHMLFATNGGSGNTERMRITASGELLVGTTSVIGGSALFNLKKNSDGWVSAFQVGVNGNFGLATFNAAGANVGGIVIGASATTYSTSSDYRLKENIADADDAGSKIDAIQVRQFDWIADGTHQDYGMVAQELQTVAPEAVSGNPDSDEMMGVDYSKLVPMLIKEVQSLRARVAELENN